MNVQEVVNQAIKQLQEKGYSDITDYRQDSLKYRVLWVRVSPVSEQCITIHTVATKFSPKRILDAVARMPKR